MLYDGSYDDAYDVCLLDSAANGWYNRCTGYNPYMTEGKKTVAYEIAEQLGWNVPDRVFVSVGDGSIIGALYKGFYDLLQLGWTKKIPKLMGVQAQGSAYFYDAVQNNEGVVLKHKIKSQTCADSISCDLPRDRLKGLRAVKKTGGDFIVVSDAEIKNAMLISARQDGFFLEPAAAAAYAGFKKAVFSLGKTETVVTLATGTGLKDINTARMALNEASDATK